MINCNGTILNEATANIFPPTISCLKGDGCFETIKMLNGEILLFQYHFERLYYSMEKLQMQMGSGLQKPDLLQQVKELAAINSHSSLARIRLTLYRKDEAAEVGSNAGGYIIQTMKGDEETKRFNEKGWKVGIYSKAKKTCDSFSFIKSNSRLPYTMAALWAKENRLEDAILYNSDGRIADTSIANVFIVEKGVITTPPLNEGCVDGVMRKHLLASLRKDGYPAHEQPLTVERLYNASEVFLTNAIRGIRWVEQINESQYSCDLAQLLHAKYVQPLFL